MNAPLHEMQVSPCPLCGHEPIIARVHDEITVNCPDCPGPDHECDLLPDDFYEAKYRLWDASRVWELQVSAEKHRIEALKTRRVAHVG